jgi:signal transduction protein with GAF and PtsI domain
VRRLIMVTKDSQRIYFHRLYQLAAEVCLARSSRDALQLLAEITAKSMSAKGCSLMTLTPDGKQLLYISAYGLSDRYVKKGPVLTDKSITQALEGEPVVVKNAPEDERVQYRREAQQEGIATIFSVPMIIRGKIIGVMRVYTADTRDFTDDDVYFVCAAANLGAIALENHRMYEACQESQKECKESQKECREKTRWLGQLLQEAVRSYESRFEELREPEEPPPERFPSELAGA